MDNFQVAKTILEQLGGNKFIAMTGAKNFVGGDGSLSFKVPGTLTKNRVNHVRIILDPSDTYTLVISRIRKHVITEVDRTAGIYNDNLQAVFTHRTGLETHL